MTSCVDILVSPAAHAVETLSATERRPVDASQRVETMRDPLLTLNTLSTSVWKTLISTTRFVTLHDTTDLFPLHAPSSRDPPTDLALALVAMVQPDLVFREEPSAAIFAARLFIGAVDGAQDIHQATRTFFVQDVPGSSAVLRFPFLCIPITADDVAATVPPLDVADAFDRRVAEASFGHRPDPRPILRPSYKNFDLERHLTSPPSPQQFDR